MAMVPPVERGSRRQRRTFASLVGILHDLGALRWRSAVKCPIRSPTRSPLKTRARSPLPPAAGFRLLFITSLD